MESAKVRVNLRDFILINKLLIFFMNKEIIIFKKQLFCDFINALDVDRLHGAPDKSWNVSESCERIDLYLFIHFYN